MKKSILFVLLIIASLCLISGCTSSSPVLQGISVTEKPDKTEYTAGDKLDLTGMEVTAAFSDGKTRIITAGNYTTDPADGTELKTAGEQLVTVTYEKATDSFTVTVKSAAAEKNNTLAPGNSWWKAETIKRSEVKSVSFVKTSPEGTPAEEWNADADDSGGVRCYVYGSAGEYKVYLAGDTIKGNADSSSMFVVDAEEEPFSNLTSVDFGDFDTSGVTNMSSMFRGCSALTSLDVSKFSTSRVTDMSGMFANCLNLAELNLGGWDTSEVTAMDGMFAGEETSGGSCDKLDKVYMAAENADIRNRLQADLGSRGTWTWSSAGKYYYPATPSTGPESYSADGDNEHAIAVDGETASYENIVVTKTGDGEGEEADFYGNNAAVFASGGAELTISDAEITTDGKYANGVFSYGEGTTVNISDSTIKTSQRNSGGIMVTGGGTLNASNLTIETQEGSSAAIRSDRGGGTMVVDGGSYTANGSGSPAIYSTADITVSNAILTSTSAQAVVVEGGNTVTLRDCDVTGKNDKQNSENSSYFQAVMLYQSMSGDAAAGNGAFTMTGGSLTSLNGGMFFVTNATYAISLSGVELTYADDELLRICAAGWGNSGSNGGQVTFRNDGQTLEGNIIVDDISALNMYLADESEFTGAFDNSGEVYVEISDDSRWNLTADCCITSLTCGAESINLNGHTLTVGSAKYVAGTSSEGSEVEFSAESGSGSGSGTEPGGPGGPGGDTPPEKPRSF